MYSKTKGIGTVPIKYATLFTHMLSIVAEIPGDISISTVATVITAMDLGKIHAIQYGHEAAELLYNVYVCSYKFPIIPRFLYISMIKDKQSSV